MSKDFKSASNAIKLQLSEESKSRPEAVMVQEFLDSLIMIGGTYGYNSSEYGMLAKGAFDRMIKRINEIVK
ncbi:MAG: hypothetical protein FWG18_01070 [Alphaproteobacteria bacterium]|nr:hypothetical protein [Alphaproteobacteria bacterium]